MTRWRWSLPQRGNGARLAAARAKADAEARLLAARELAPFVEYMAESVGALPADELIARMRQALTERQP